MRFRVLLILVLAHGCSAGADEGGVGLTDAGTGPVNPGTCQSSNECPTGFICNEFGRCVKPLPPMGDAGMPEPPPETEVEIGEPISSDRYVYVAMTTQDELARIDGHTLEVKSTGVGESPRILRTIPNSDGAVVLDSVNGTATIVRPNGATDTIRVLATLKNLNRLDVDPSGRYAVIWFDLAQALQEGGINGIGSFQDVTVVALGQGVERAVNLTVGFRPRSVQFDAAGTRAYVITQDGISVVDMGYATTHEPSIVPPVPIADPSVMPEHIEVSVVSNGRYAAVRMSGQSLIRIVDVNGPQVGRLMDIPLASIPTDVDLAPDGTRVYVVQREAKKLSIVDVPGDALNPTGVETIDLGTATIGSFVVSRDGQRALLFTNATLDERITKIELATAGYPRVTWPLKKAVRAVGISPNGQTAVVLNAKAPGDPATATGVDDFIDKSYGYTLLDLASGFGKLQITTVDPGPFVYTPDGSKAYVALDGGDAPTAKRAIQVATLQNGVVIEKVLGSPPSAVGILPGAGEAFVAQRHPLGRVTFVDILSDAVRTVTGFDLNSDIVQ